ncbi:hypothetical protein WN943_003062 [Citrus x changshan-huyou]
MQLREAKKTLEGPVKEREAAGFQKDILPSLASLLRHEAENSGEPQQRTRSEKIDDDEGGRKIEVCFVPVDDINTHLLHDDAKSCVGPPLETVRGPPLEDRRAAKCHVWCKVPHTVQGATL